MVMLIALISSMTAKGIFSEDTKMLKIFRIVTVVLVLNAATNTFAAQVDLWELPLSGLTVTQTDPVQTASVLQMFGPNIVIYQDGVGIPMWSTTFTVPDYKITQTVNLVGIGAYSGLNFIRGTRGIILKAIPQNPGSIDPALIDGDGYVTILDQAIYLPDDTDVPPGAAVYEDLDGTNYLLDHTWTISASLQFPAKVWKVSYLADDSGYFSPRIDNLNGKGLAPPKCGDPTHPFPAGDWNKDCYVNFKDLAIFVSQWLNCTSPAAPCNYLP
jgi:hypothetical protein